MICIRSLSETVDSDWEERPFLLLSDWLIDANPSSKSFLELPSPHPALLNECFGAYSWPLCIQCILSLSALPKLGMSGKNRHPILLGFKKSLQWISVQCRLRNSWLPYTLLTNCSHSGEETYFLSYSLHKAIMKIM